MKRLLEALGNAADGAFVIDEHLRIIYWNKAAEGILGFNEEEAIGSHCHHLLHGYSDNRLLICEVQCQVAKLALNSKPVPNYDIQVTTKQRDRRWVNMSVFSYRMSQAGDKKVIVHLFHELKFDQVNEKLLTHIVEAARNFRDYSRKDNKGENAHPDELTPREREVLVLLARGNGTEEMAELLSLSPNTIRNHLQNIFQKFQVHSRLEAVIYASKNDLL